MVALVATDVTVTAELRDRITEGKKHRTQATLVYGDGALTYPSGGIPLPAFGTFGMKRNVDFLDFFDAGNANGYVYKYDKTNHKLRIYQGDNDNAADAPLIEVTTAHAPAATTLRAEVVGW